jgi:hypothetical protein
MAKPIQQRRCLRCNTRYVPRAPNQKWCNTLCGKLAYYSSADLQPPPSDKRGCKQCGGQFLPKTRLNVFCSLRCQRERSSVTTGHALRVVGANQTVVIGSAHELKVAAELLLRGWFVFRSTSYSSPCDLIAMTAEGFVVRIEVTTGHRRNDNGLVWGRKSSRYKFDAMAVVEYDGTITYIPPVEQWSGA